MAGKVTISDIAKNLGLSRNTVSRVLNGSEGIANETRMRVLDEAARVNYKMLGTRLDATRNTQDIHIMLVTKDMELISGSIFNFMMFILQPMVRSRNATLTMQFMSDQEMESGRIPGQIEDMDAIIIFEVLNERYIQKLLDTGKPCVLFDCTSDLSVFHGSFDIVMEDGGAIVQLIRCLTSEGMRRFGFVGDPNHCYGYHGRFNAFRNALADYGGLPHEQFDLIEPEFAGMNFRKEYKAKLKNMKMPEVFICANNYLAQQVIEAVTDLGLSVPEQIQVYGFGMRNFHIYGRNKESDDYRQMEDLTAAMVMLLFDRIQHPQTCRRVVRIQASILPVSRDDF